MDWNTASALAAQRRAGLARDAALVRVGRAIRNRRARNGADDVRPVTRGRDLDAEVSNELATGS
jgi:hypothetical protein